MIMPQEALQKNFPDRLASVNLEEQLRLIYEAGRF